MSLFISIEGVSGAGKSTQIQLLQEYLLQKGVDCVFTREPGGTEAGEVLRTLLLDRKSIDLGVITEALLFAAARAELVKNVIRPALEQGKVVISDRYVDSSLAYQAYGGGLPVEFVAAVNEMATGGLKPHRTILLNCPPEVGMRRQAAGDTDRFDERDKDFHSRVREGYLELAQREPRRIRLVDAAGPLEEVQAKVRALVEELLPRRR